MLLHCEGRVVRGGDSVARLGVIGAFLGALLGGTACSSGSTGPKTGKLDVTIAAPSGVTPSVTVSGPGGYSRTLSASTVLAGLAPGSYTVTAATVTTTNAIAGAVYTGAVSGSPVAITPSVEDFAVTARYAQRPGTGGLWVALSQPQSGVVQFTVPQLDGVIIGATPAITLGTGTNLNLNLAFDTNGNLWVTFPESNSVVEYASGQLSASGTPAPAITITANAGSLNDPSGIAFDASGNLWVTNGNTNTVVEFTASQLASSGSPTPAVTISASRQSLLGPSGVAFDSSGDLWVVNNPVSTVVEFTPAQLAATGAPTPAVTLSANANPTPGAHLIAFDAKGDLWFGNGLSNTLLAFAPAQLAASGSPTPAVILSANAGSLDVPYGLAFDASGDLWVSNLDGGSVVEFSAAQIAASGSPTPTATISGASVSPPAGLAFDPRPSGLPPED